MLIKALIWLLLLVDGANAQGFIATPSPLTLIGYANVVNGSTTVVTVANSVPANALIVVASSETSVAVSGTVTDSNGNSYSSGAQPFGGATGFTKLSFATANAVLNKGVTITFTLGQASKNAVVAAYYARGFSTTDTSGGISGTSTTPSVMTGTPSQANELFVAAIGGPTTIASFTQDATWSPLPKEVSLIAPYLAVAAVINPQAIALTYTPVLGTSVRWGIGVFSFTP